MRKIYLFMLMAVGLLISGNAGAQETPTWPQTFESDETAVDAGAVAKIGSDYYATLNSAFAAAPASTETTVTLLTDISPVIKSGNYSVVGKNQNIILELNGHVIDLAIQECKSSAVISNSGTLTIQDNSDKLSDFESPFTQEVIKQYRGSGSGKISCFAQNPDMQPVPGVATNTITNTGTLTVKSGTIDNRSVGTASYAIDNQGAGKVYISGGKISSNQSNSIRMFCPDNQSIEITGGEIYRIWVQDNNSASKVASLSITNATLTQGLLVGYYDVIENFTLTMDNCIVGDYILYELPAVETNTLTINNCKSGALYMINPRAVLTNGLYRFEGEVGLGWCYVDESEEYKPRYGEEAWKAKGVRIGEQYPDNPIYINYYQGYLSPEALLHNFYDYIAPGYGLKARPDVGPNWYEVALTQGTTDTQDVEGHDGELGNPWHQDKTWDLTNTEVVPEETTAVLIDHNVYVEEGSKAVAASVQIEAGQTLTVKSGATLQILDAGALFKDETAKLIIEPEAVVTVGSNGVISQDMENIIIKASATEVGNFLLNPDAHLNTQPLATVKMVANIGMQGSDYKWHRFAMPVTRLENAWGKSPDLGTYLYGWDYENKDWKNMEGSTNMVPFRGYTVTTKNMAPGEMEFTFEGDLLGNVKSNIDFTSIGYGYFGNSYTGYILAKTMLEDFNDIEGVEGQVWMWDAANQSYSSVSLTDLLKDRDLAPFQREIAPMHTFILKTNSGEGATIDIDYIAAIWGNPRYGLVGAPVSAPARATNTDDAFVGIKVISANGVVDRIRMTENAENSDMYENGVDATKYMNENSINLYATVDGEDYTSLYTDNLLGKKLTLQTMDEVNYTLHINDVIGSEYALQDMLTGEIISLQAGKTYSFSAQPNSTVERFQIVSARTMPTGTDKIVATKASKGIFTMLGQYMGEASNWHKLPAGAYLVNGVKIVK